MKVEHVYTVHMTRPDDVGAVEIVFVTEREARHYAADRSRDFHVRATSVTGFVIGELGTRHAVAWFVDGIEQPHRAVRPGRLYPTDGRYEPASHSSAAGWVQGDERPAR